MVLAPLSLPANLSRYSLRSVFNAFGHYCDDVFSGFAAKG